MIDKLELQVLTARANINLTISKMIVRAKLSATSDSKKKGAVDIATDLKEALHTLIILEKEYRASRQINYGLELAYRKVERRNKELENEKEELLKLI